MKNGIICLLTITILFFTAGTAQAGFAVKKSANATTTQTIITKNTSGIATIKNNPSELQQMLQQFAPPTLDRMTNRGWIGTLALLFGILGFFAPIFSVAAVVFGFIGTTRGRRQGLAIAGLVLGIAAILITIINGGAAITL